MFIQSKPLEALKRKKSCVMDSENPQEKQNSQKIKRGIKEMPELSEMDQNSAGELRSRESTLKVRKEERRFRVTLRATG